MDTQGLFDALQSHALATGLFERVNTAEPKSAPGNGLSCAIWANNISPAAGGSGLSQTTGRVEFMVRLYSDFRAEPEDVIDPQLLMVSDVLMSAYSGDFDLGVSGVRDIDLLGTYGTPLSAQAGYLEQDGTIFRVIDITVPVIVNDLWAQVA